MLGLVLISGIADAEPYGEDPMKGVLFGIFTAVFYSAFLITFRACNRGLAPVSSVQFDATAGAALGMLVLGILPLSSLSVEPIDFQLTWPGHGWLILLAILSQVGGWLAVAYALPRLPAAHTSFAILLQPVLTLLWGFLILNQDGHSSNQLLGMFLVLVAIASVTIYGSTTGEEVELE
jgi:drug/metabolite transporter (DMT)-like permease